MQFTHIKKNREMVRNPSSSFTSDQHHMSCIHCPILDSWIRANGWHFLHKLLHQKIQARTTFLQLGFIHFSRFFRIQVGKSLHTPRTGCVLRNCSENRIGWVESVIKLLGASHLLFRESYRHLTTPFRNRFPGQMDQEADCLSDLGRAKPLHEE